MKQRCGPRGWKGREGVEAQIEKKKKIVKKKKRKRKKNFVHPFKIKEI